MASAMEIISAAVTANSASEREASRGMVTRFKADGAPQIAEAFTQISQINQDLVDARDARKAAAHDPDPIIEKNSSTMLEVSAELARNLAALLK